MSKRAGAVALLAGEREYMEALAKQLSERHDWTIIVADQLCQGVEDADVIVTESSQAAQLTGREELLQKAVLLAEEAVEEPQDEGIFPQRVYKYDGFRRMERRICRAMGLLRGEEGYGEKNIVPVMVLGAWESERGQSRRIAWELAHKIDGTVLYIGLERFPAELPEETQQGSQREDCSLEDLLYYALERMEMGGGCRADYVRTFLSFADGVCSLPGFAHINPLCRLETEKWNSLLSVLCTASRAKLILLWTGREEMTRCQGLGQGVKRCIYLRPQGDEQGWSRLHRWMQEEGKAFLGTEVRLVSSWTELFRMAVNRDADVA